MNEPVGQVCRVLESHEKLPPGEYPGTHEGYQVRWEILGTGQWSGIYVGPTEKGVRGLNIPCTVIVDADGNVGIKPRHNKTEFHPYPT